MPPIEGKLNPPQYPNMDYNLNRIVREAEAGGFTAQAMTAAASGAPIHSEQSVAVTLYIKEGYADAISSYLSDNGASPRNIGADYIEAYIPVSLLADASQQEGVRGIRTIIPPQPAQGAVVSEGAAAHGAPAWHAAGIRGQDVKIGIIDTGFEGFSALMGAELPTTVQARCYTDIGAFTSNLSDCENDDEHGTAVTEAAFDIAPEATYYISNPISWGDLQNTIQWMVDQDVDVINHSASWEWDGPGDGTSPFTSSPLRTVDTAVANGITWVNVAGNGAMATWYGAFADTDSDKWHNFSGNVECNDVELYAGEEYITQLRWDDRWGNGLSGATRDLDLHLFDPLLLSFNINLAVASSELEQTGGGEDDPFESLAYTPVSDGTYCLAIRHFGGAAPSWIQLQSFSGEDLEHHTISGSIENPAESANPGLLAVGATHYWNTRAIADYSSQGPTPDERVKPDIVGIACGEVVSYDLAPPEFYDGNNCWFPGTSQAAPHVAGMAVLVKQRFPDYTPQQVAQYLKDNAEARGATPNNTWGHGFAKLPASDAPVATPTDRDKEALVALYNATNGTGWTDSTNWLNDGIPLNSWHGVGTDADGRVTSLSLSSNNLAGSLPSELGNLAKLRHLGLAGNQISGAIPAEIGNLTNLTNMRLGYNQLTGAVPGELGNLTSLTDLRLDNNQLSGTIPSELGNLSNIETIYLQGNQLAGALPQTFTQLVSLEVFAFGNGGAGLCAPTDQAFQNWLQGISNQDIAAGVTPLGPNCADSTVNPTPVAGCTEAVTIPATVNGAWTSDCSSEKPSPAAGGGARYARFYTFTLAQASDLEITLESSVDTFLYLLAGHGADGATVDDNDNHDSNVFSLAATTDSGISATLNAGDYTIEATTYGAGTTGDFTLNVEIVGESAADCTNYSESPDLAEKVASGELPSVCDRLPSEPLTIPTLGDTGEYGGVVRRFYLGPADGCNFFRLSRASLARFSQDGFSLLPSVARDWETSEDGKEWTFYLREGMKWSDGDDFTADDFVYQYEDVIMNEDLTPTSPPFLRIGNEIGVISKVDDTTVKFTFPVPNFLFLEIVAQADEACYGSTRNVPWAPSHYMKQFHAEYNPDAQANAEAAEFESWTQHYDSQTQYNLNPDKPTIAPWKFTNPLGDRVVMSERNPYFWAVDPAGNQLPYLDGIQLALVESAELGTLRAAQGEIDMQGRHIQLDQYVLLKEGRVDGGYTVLTWPAFGGSDVAFFFNMSLPGATGDAIRTKKFRQALSLAIDREAINRDLFLGLGEIRQNVPPPGHPHYPGDDIAKLRTEYDVEEANRLLDNLFPDKDGEGWRLSNGERIVMSVTVTDAFGAWPGAAQVVGRAWEAVGVKTDVSVTTRSQHFTRWQTNEWAVMVWNEDTTGSTFSSIAKRTPAYPGSFHGPGCAQWLVEPDGENAFPCAQESIDLLQMHRRGPELPKVERDALGREIYKTVVENQYNIGIVGLSPMAHGIIVKKNELRNVPDLAANDWAFRTPNTAFPEQWYFGSEIEPVVALPAALSAGPSHACSLSQNGEISCMGVDDSGQVSDYPDGGFTVISVGAEHSCAIDEERAIHCWGSDDSGQVSDRPTVGEFVAIDAGASHTCAIDISGSIHCWGSDEHGQSSPPKEGEFVAIGAGDSYTCGLRSDGTLECWGRFASDEGTSP